MRTTSHLRSLAMAVAFRRRFVLTTVLLIVLATATHADIYRWDTGQLILGTEDIEPGPAVQLDHMALEYAQL